jgi:hypothetical protein
MAHTRRSTTTTKTCVFDDKFALEPRELRILSQRSNGHMDACCTVVSMARIGKLSHGHSCAKRARARNDDDDNVVKPRMDDDAAYSTILHDAVLYDPTRPTDRPSERSTSTGNFQDLFTHDVVMVRYRRSWFLEHRVVEGGKKTAVRIPPGKQFQPTTSPERSTFSPRNYPARFEDVRHHVGTQGPLGA